MFKVRCRHLLICPEVAVHMTLLVFDQHNVPSVEPGSIT
jgi:hypothetical protein